MAEPVETTVYLESEFLKAQEININATIAATGYMYILECADGSFYTGSTKNLKLRIEQHQRGEGANYTTKHLPVILLYYETYDRIDAAFNREKQV